MSAGDLRDDRAFALTLLQKGIDAVAFALEGLEIAARQRGCWIEQVEILAAARRDAAAAGWADLAEALRGALDDPGFLVDREKIAADLVRFLKSDTDLAFLLGADAEAEAAEAEVGHARDRPSGRLRITAPVSYGVRRLADPVADFLADFPDLEVELVLNDRAVDLIEEGFDVAMRIGVLRDSTLIARRLAPIEVETAAAPAYLARHGEPATPVELSGHACLGYSYLDGGTVWSFRGPAGPVRRRFKPRLLANNGDVLAAAAVRGEGVVHMPRFILEDRIAAGQLQPILAAWRPPAHGLYAVYPAGRPLPAKTRAFIDFMAETLA